MNAVAWSCTPMRRSREVSRGHGLVPRSDTVPPSGRRSPSTISSVVVLPAPLGPRIPKHSPLRTSKLIESTTVRPS